MFAVCDGKKWLLSTRYLIAITPILACASCGPNDSPTEPAPTPEAATRSAASGTADSTGSTPPDLVLYGTDVLEYRSFREHPLDEFAAGSYWSEQGGAEVSLTLSMFGADWHFERIHQEPGEPPDRAFHTLKLSRGLMRSVDDSVIVRGSEDGILVLERESDTIPADYWVHYARRD